MRERFRVFAWALLTVCSCILPIIVLAVGSWIPLRMSQTLSQSVVILVVASTLLLCGWYLYCVMWDPLRSKWGKVRSLLLMVFLGAFAASIGLLFYGKQRSAHELAPDAARHDEAPGEIPGTS
jgi:cation transport ATPase